MKKKDKRAVALAKREKFEADEKARGLKAQKRPMKGLVRK